MLAKNKIDSLDPKKVRLNTYIKNFLRILKTLKFELVIRTSNRSK